MIVGNYPICSGLNQTITGVAGTLAATSATVNFGSSISMLLTMNSPNKKMVRMAIQDVFVASAKHVGDPTWGNRTLVTGNALATLGTSLAFAATNGLVQNSAAGANSLTNTISFKTNANANANLGLLKPEDLGTAGNGFTIYVGTRLYFDQLSLPAVLGRRASTASAPRKRRLEWRAVEGIASATTTEDALDVLPISVQSFEVIGIDPFAPAAQIVRRSQMKFRAAKLKTSVTAEVMVGKIQSVNSEVSVNAEGATLPTPAPPPPPTKPTATAHPSVPVEGSPPASLVTPSKTVPVAAIVGAVFGVLVLVAVIAGIAAWGVIRKKRRAEAAAAAAANSETSNRRDSSPPEMKKVIAEANREPGAQNFPIPSPEPATPVDATPVALPAKAISGPDDYRTAQAIAEMESAVKSQKRAAKKAKKKVAWDPSMPSSSGEILYEPEVDPDLEALRNDILESYADDMEL